MDDRQPGLGRLTSIGIGRSPGRTTSRPARCRRRRLLPRPARRVRSWSLMAVVALYFCGGSPRRPRPRAWPRRFCSGQTLSSCCTVGGRWPRARSLLGRLPGAARPAPRRSASVAGRVGGRLGGFAPRRRRPCGSHWLGGVRLDRGARWAIVARRPRPSGRIYAWRPGSPRWLLSPVLWKEPLGTRWRDVGARQRWSRPRSTPRGK